MRGAGRPAVLGGRAARRRVLRHGLRLRRRARVDEQRLHAAAAGGAAAAAAAALAALAAAAVFIAATAAAFSVATNRCV